MATYCRVIPRPWVRRCDVHYTNAFLAGRGNSGTSQTAPLDGQRRIPIIRKGRLSGAGIAALGPKPRTSKPAPGHKIFPYLLRGVAIERPNQVRCADITYIPIGRGFLYLVAIMDWASRAVLSWRLSNTMDVSRWRRPWRALAPRRSSTPTRLPIHQLGLHRRADRRRRAHLDG
jgi:transposase InsO family protein